MFFPKKLDYNPEAVISVLNKQGHLTGVYHNLKLCFVDLDLKFLFLQKDERQKTHESQSRCKKILHFCKGRGVKFWHTFVKDIFKTQ